MKKIKRRVKVTGEEMKLTYLNILLLYFVFSQVFSKERFQIDLK